jgi:polyisoprenoid-binding protein YceI
MAERIWKIDPAHSSVGFSVKHMMFTTVRGRFRDVEGTVRADEERPERSSVEVEIRAASIDTGVPDRDAHLRSADFFDVERHPTITFRSRRVEGASALPEGRFRIVGELTMLGIPREVVLDAVFEGRGTDPWGKTRAGARATAEIDRRDWGLTWNRTLDAGGILVGNTLRLEIEIQAVEAGPAGSKSPELEEAHARS